MKPFRISEKLWSWIPIWSALEAAWTRHCLEICSQQRVRNKRTHESRSSFDKQRTNGFAKKLDGCLSRDLQLDAFVPSIDAVVEGGHHLHGDARAVFERPAGALLAVAVHQRGFE